MRILIIVSQPHVRTALHYLLSQQADIELIGAVGSGAGLVSKLALAEPEIVVLDWALPRHAAARLIAAGRRLPNRPRTIVLGSRPEEERAALEAGADAFVHESDSPDVLLGVVRSFAPLAPGE